MFRFKLFVMGKHFSISNYQICALQNFHDYYLRINFKYLETRIVTYLLHDAMYHTMSSSL